ncbi:type III pantothenate kinase [Haloflavibacter putidus]|uniref:Type III pantothenate kinase n=1 Tax=Haloflavibacter putidus TaxID=2576776 RepID=A0A507ZLG1_9FLAO|nr:type III pantothenate kinase [Haloflavibacter putidus]TQD38526.1 type III pantothenate kinase [Haloflavibacter putidus]
MNLIIDIGNTFTKIAVFQEATLLQKQQAITADTTRLIKEVLQNFPKIERSILAAVADVSQSTLEVLQKNTKLLLLNAQTKVPFANNYHSQGSLGIDRIALAAASVAQFPKRNVLVIDAGTCITYDLIEKDAIYQGGSISPGIKMRYLALHNFTAKLPLLNKETFEVNNFPAKTTVENIHLGVVQGVIFEIDGFINQYKNQFSNLTVIFTGGDAEFLSKKVKNSIFVPQNFLLQGLNHILEYNNI